MSMSRSAIALGSLLGLASCAGLPQPEGSGLALPAPLARQATVLGPGDPEYVRAVPWNALKAPGQGGLAGVLVVRLDADLPVYRGWNGPGVVDAGGHTNRIGAWWAATQPHGSTQSYRDAYEVCRSWNELKWVARCTLKKGAVVAVGPGQSVSGKTCGDADEAYATSADWQVFVDQPWTRPAELDCTSTAGDYAANPAELSRPAP